MIATAEAHSQPTSVAAPTARSRPDVPPSIVALVVGATFATTLANPLVMGGLPFRYILKDQLGVSGTQMALFFGGAALAWYGKPILGLVADRVLQGRSLGGPLAAVCAAGALGWAGLALLPQTYAMLLLGALLLNVAVATAANLVGGITVQAGQHHNATGTLNAGGMAARHVGYLIVGPLGAWLAALPLGFMCAIGAATMAFAAVAAFLLSRRDAAPSAAPVERFEWRRLLRSRALGVCALAIFLLQIAPGFETPLFFLQTEELGFSKAFLGKLQLAGAVAGIAAACLYGALCRRVSPVALLAAGILADATISAAFFFYRDAGSAAVLSVGAGFATTLAFVPMMDIAARATPRLIACGGFALMMSVRTITVHGSDVAGAWMFERLGLTFHELLWINSGTTLLALAALPILARTMQRQE